MAQTTPLYQKHQQAGAKLVDFAGWAMPVQYGSIVDEPSSEFGDVTHIRIWTQARRRDHQSNLRVLMGYEYKYAIRWRVQCKVYTRTTSTTALLRTVGGVDR